MNFRRVLLWLHRWVGVIAGLVVLVVALTGGALVFEPQVDRWLNPQLYPHAPRATPHAVEEMLGVLGAKFPDARVLGMKLPRDEWDALVLHMGKRAAYFDLATGEMLGTRPRNEGFTRTLTKLHVSLLAGKTGGWIVGVATMVTLGLALSGLWLWWPLRIFGFRRGANFRRFNLDLHSAAGLYSSIFLLIIAGTGTTLFFLHADHPAVPRSTLPSEQRPRITIDDALARAERALPGTRAVSSEMPVMPRMAFRVQLAFPEDHSPAGRSVVFLDQYSGETLGVTSSREGTLMWRYLNLHLSIHTGGVFGWPSQWLALLTCVALCAQVVSGYVLWWKRA